MKSRRKELLVKQVIFLSLLVLSLFVLGARVAEVKPDGGVDFYQYWAAGRITNQDNPEVIYQAESACLQKWSSILLARAHTRSRREWAAASFRPCLEFYSSPALFSCFSFFSTFSYDHAILLYRLLIMGAILLFFFLGGVALGYPSWALPGMVVITAGIYAPWLIDLRVGNVNSLQLAGLSLVLASLAKSRFLLAGLAMGALVVFKPNLILILPFVALTMNKPQQLKRLGIGLIGGGFGLGLLSCLNFPDLTCWKLWVDALISMPAQVIEVSKGNFSPSLYLSSLLGINLFPFLIVFLFLIALLACFLGFRQAQASLKDTSLYPAGGICLGLMVFLVGAPLVWVHYSVLALPAGLFLLSPKTRVPLFPRIGGGIALLLLAIIPENYLLGCRDFRIDLLATVLGLGILYLLLIFGFIRNWWSIDPAPEQNHHPPQPTP